ncbi:MAG TPA: hypothetical protein VEQ60_13100 [Longimicrobium sp.]|nr:hypothetical protein [Longimicrobium sp.]
MSALEEALEVTLLVIRTLDLAAAMGVEDLLARAFRDAGLASG